MDGVALKERGFAGTLGRTSIGHIAMNNASHILRTFLHVRDEGRTIALPESDTFWQDLSEGAYPELECGRLMSAFTFSETWATWERHPAGEEWVLLLSGAASLVLEEDGIERVVPLNHAGEFVLVPRNVWHTARTNVATTLVFLTPGAGTEHRPA